MSGNPEEMVSYPVKLPRSLVERLNALSKRGFRKTQDEIRRGLTRYVEAEEALIADPNKPRSGGITIHESPETGDITATFE